MESVAEVWRDVAGYEGEYQVSNLGNVRSLDRYVNARGGLRRLVRGVSLRLMRHPLGYRGVSLRGVHRVLVHRLVANAFIGPSPEGCTDVNHKNGVKYDNRVENLEYCTHRENVRHAIDCGLLNNRGERNGRATARNSQIEAAYQLVLSGKTHAEAAASTGVAKHVVAAAVSGRHWGLPAIRRRVSHKWPAEAFERCIELRRAGKTIVYISAHLGIPQETVRRHCNKALASPQEIT